jgi:hypothetical protein
VKAFGEAPKFVDSAVKPLIGVITTNWLGMVERFPSGGIDDGVSAVQDDSNVCNLDGKAG